MTPLEALLEAYKEHAPQVDIWRRYPDVTEQEDDATDQWACGEVSRSFAAFAREHGWSAVVIHAEGAEAPLADYHYWVRLLHPRLGVHDVDWTVRQYHNLHEEGGRDEAVLSLPWPLVWSPLADPDTHPIAGSFRTVRHDNEEES